MPRACFLNGPSEIIIHTCSLEKTLLFYRETLGFTTMSLDKTSCLVLSGKTRLRIIEDTYNTRGMDIVFSVSALLWNDLVNKLAQKDQNYNTEDREILLTDPLGNRVYIVPCENRKKGGRPTGSSHGRPSSGAAKWQSIYEHVPLEQLPWYYEGVDSDIQDALSEFIPIPACILDLGCGPATQSARLSAVGYTVVAVDIAIHALEQTKSLYRSHEALDFLCADVSDHNGLPVKLVDGAVDRGCFHSLLPETRPAYVRNVSNALKPGGRLVLKVFSKDEPGKWGPNRLSIEELIDSFVPSFKLISCKKGVFEGGTSYPKSICMVLEKV